MTVKQGREAAHKWMADEAGRIPGLRGAYTAGSRNWLACDAELAAASDVDIMAVLDSPNQPLTRRKFIYGDALLEASYLRMDQFRSPAQVLSNYHLAPSLRTTKVLVDAFGCLTPLQTAVSCEYASRRWVRQRCAGARDKVLGSLRSINAELPVHDRVMACLFAAGITTHVLLVAGLRNPTVRARYVAVRELLSDYGHGDFHEILLKLLGSARISRARVCRHLTGLTEIFDVAKTAIETPSPFASDISEIARASAIDSSLDLISRGYHREAMFWIIVTHSRCRKILSCDAPEHLTKAFQDSYQELADDLGIGDYAAVRQRWSGIERIMSRLCDVAESIIAEFRGCRL